MASLSNWAAVVWLDFRAPPPPLFHNLPINIPKHSTRVEWLEWWKGWP